MTTDMTNVNRRRLIASSLMGSLGLAGTLPTWAKAPDLKTVRLTVGFPAGDMADSLARVVSDFIKGDYAETIVIDNKPGAAARIATSLFVKARPDGTEVLFTPGAMVVLFPHVFQKLPYDPMKELVPVTKIATASIGLAVGPAVPPEVKTLDQYLAWCRLDPKNAVYATSGAGTGIHLTGEYLAKLTNVKLSMIPYRGGAPAAADLVAGQVPAQMATIPSLIEHAKAGRARFIAIASDQRHHLLPDTPTFKELGYPALVTDDFFGFFMPTGAPEPAIASLNQAVLASLKDDKVRGTLERMGLAVSPSASTADFKALVDREYAKWAGIAKAINFNPMES
jgi:tripartite-type tricarboxylate transporter receptor subunit TctC